MATARKAWVRQPTSILREPWRPLLKLFIVQLSCALGDRWARDRLPREEACRAVFSREEMMHLGGVRDARALRRLCADAASAVRLSCVERAGYWYVDWPKWAELQCLPPDAGATAGHRPAQSAPAPAPVPSREEEEKKKTVPRSQPAGWAVTLSELLITLLEPVPGARIPRGAKTRWASEIEALAKEAPELANGNATKHLEAGIRWALGPENLGREFEVVIRSGQSLRQKWPQLVAAARRKRKSDPIDFEAELRKRMANGADTRETA